MTDYEREYAYRKVKDQLECGYLDISETHDEHEIEIAKRALNALPICEQYKRVLDAITPHNKDLERDGYVCIVKEEYEKLLICKKRYEDLCR